MEKIQVAIIGGGIIGLQTALELSKYVNPEEIVLLEKNPFCGDETSARHSSVLHSGIYYPMNSKKHRLCMHGLELWNDLCQEFQIDKKNCGKYLFATTQNELEDLNKYKQLALEKNIPFRSISNSEQEKLRIYTHLLDGIFIESTSVIDAPSAIKKIETSLFNRGVIFQKNITVLDIVQHSESYELDCGDYRFECEYLINCAGHGAVDLRKKLGLFDIENFFVKGNYIKTHQKFYNESLLYPIPHHNLLGLGIHTSFDLDGTLRFGPNTEPIAEINYSMNSNLISEFIGPIQKQFIGIETEKLELDYCGIRPKILLNGELYTDFIIQSPLAKYIECLGIESPGLTSSPAIAEFIVSQFFQRP
ncbi:MAG: FAD-dependent oxidoreductase [Halobacteriovoraceae bacterium]|nr:FAD-dependent oxidoreductase [Halobacteriovoraceae bacterium]